MYSVHRPDLAALGAVDGRPPSGMPQDNDDALSRRDMGLEFLDVTTRAQTSLLGSDRHGNRQRDTYRITNHSTSIVDTHLLVIVKGLAGASLANASGVTSGGDPYLRLHLPEGALMPGQDIDATLVLRDSRGRRGHDGPPVRYRLELLSGQGKP